MSALENGHPRNSPVWTAAASASKSLAMREEGCRFTLEAATEPIGGIFGRLIVPIIAWGMRREVRMHVRNLRRILEVPEG